MPFKHKILYSRQGPRSGFLLMGLIEDRRCEISRRKTFEIKSPEMPGNTSNFNNHHVVFASILIFLMQTYVLNKNYWSGFKPSQPPRYAVLGRTICSELIPRKTFTFVFDIFSALHSIVY